MFVDIAFNATSEIFKEDYDGVFNRAMEAGVLPIIVGLDVESSREAARLAEKYHTLYYMGIHPLHCENPLVELEKLRVLFDELEDDSNMAALGECGLDYFRAENYEEQKMLFKHQLAISRNMPLFLHCRSSFDDLIECLDEVYGDTRMCGVVHSFDGSIEQASEIIRRGMFIGLNGCSMRNEESIEVVRSLPLTSILLETDSPYCSIRKSYAGSRFVKKIIKCRNNEPCNILQIAEAVACIKSISIEEVEAVCFENTLRLFPSLISKIDHWAKKKTS